MTALSEISQQELLKHVQMENKIYPDKSIKDCLIQLKNMNKEELSSYFQTTKEIFSSLVKNQIQRLDDSILIEYLDVRSLKDGKQFKEINGEIQEIFPSDKFNCYLVDYSKVFENKETLTDYLVSLDPYFKFKKLSELFYHLKDKKLTIDVTITFVTNKQEFLKRN
jgi:hypothetical protein